MSSTLRASLLVLALVLASCAAPGASEAPSEAPPESENLPASDAPASEAPAEPEADSLTLVIASSPDFAQVNLPKWREYVEADGITVDLQNVEATDIALRSVVSGAADVYVGSLAPLIRAVQETNVDLRLIAVDAQATDYLFVAQPDIESLEDLAGQSVGIGSAGDLTESVIRAVTPLATGSDTLADEFEFLPFGGTGGRLAALLSGQVQMTPLHAPDAFAAIDEGMHSLVTAADHLEGYLQTGLITSQAWLDEHPVLAQLLVDRFVEANRWAADNKDEYLVLGAEWAPGLSDEHMSAAWDVFSEIGLFAANGGMEASQLESYLEVSQSTGALTEDAPSPDVWAAPQYVEDFLAREGDR